MKTWGSAVARGALAGISVMTAATLTACSSGDTADGQSTPTSVGDTPVSPPSSTAVSSTTALESPTTTVAAATIPEPSTNSSPPPPPAEAVTVTGPISGGSGQPLNAGVDLASLGYGEEEFFLDGQASSYRLAGPRSPDGFWVVAPDQTAEFTTRLLVRRPLAAADFSGIVVVEWLNVSTGRDLAHDWGYLHAELIREGHAWVGVSAQAVGVVGHGTTGDGAGADGLVGSDPIRYGTLSHPGDPFSFDIFTKAGAALTDGVGIQPLGDLLPTQLIAAGISQSADLLVTYVNAVQPTAAVYDGFFIHARSFGAPELTGVTPTTPQVVNVRDDVGQPVLIFETETDLTIGYYFFNRQPDTDMIRTWEVAGTAHLDRYMIDDFYHVSTDPDLRSASTCDAPFNDGPHREVAQAAFHHLVEWVINGATPPESQQLNVTPADPPTIARDSYGNALGGIRTPLVDVPVATLTGEPTPGAGPGEFCFLYGTTVPFDSAALASLYANRDDYITRFTTAADAAVAAGFLLRSDADEMVAQASAFDLAGG